MTQLPDVLSRLRALLGPAHLRTEDAVERYRLGPRVPKAVACPGDEAAVSGVLALAAEAGLAVVPWGAGLHQALGARPRAYDLALDLTRLDRVLAYEPADLTATVQAGVRLDALRAALGTAGQFLPLDPPLGEAATLGGVLGAGLSGPLRCRYGTARDLILGLRVAQADGTIIRAGAQVVKNATAYDLVKLHLGAHGTLGVILEATLRLFPRPACAGTWWAAARDLEPAQAVAERILGSHLAPDRLELIARGTARRLGLPGESPGALIAFSGVPEAVAAQGEALGRLAREAGGSAPVPAGEGTWKAVRDFPWPEPSAGGGPRALWRASVLPADTAKAMKAVAAAAGEGAEAAAAASVAAGVLRGWIAAGAPAGLEQALRAAREAVERLGGFLVVLDAPEAVRERLDVWGRPPGGHEIMQALKRAFDPRGSLGPGRLVGGI